MWFERRSRKHFAELYMEELNGGINLRALGSMGYRFSNKSNLILIKDERVFTELKRLVFR
jgi:hypothetical protein